MPSQVDFGIRYAPESLSVASVRLVEPYAKLIIHRDRTTNVQDILKAAPAPRDSAPWDSAGADVATTETPPASPATATAAPGRWVAAGAPPAFPVRIGRIEVVKGSSDYADLSLVLPFAARIEDLRGHVTGLSSDSASLAIVELDG